MNKKTKNFIKFVRKQAKSVDIKVLLAPSNKVMIDKIKVNGYLDDEDEMVLKCAINKPETQWLPIFVHEYAHLTQFIDKCSSWKTYSKEDNDILFSWLAGQRFHMKSVIRFTRRARALELDCEKRCVKIIKEFNLPIDIETHIRKANSYVFFYNYVLETRRWYKKDPYTIPQVYGQFRKTFMPNYSILPDKYRKLYDKYCV